MKILTPSFIQLCRYAIVGLALNTFGYSVYLLVTWLGLEPKLAVTILYPISVMYGYFAHNRISFRYTGRLRDIWPMIRYVLVYFFGYVLNIGLLQLFHNQLGYPHQWVQAASIFIVAGFLFISLKLFVFQVATVSKTVKL